MRRWHSLLRWVTASRPGSAGLEIADEVEAFLDGRYLERGCASGRPGTAEAWAWLNAVAHAPLSRIAELTEHPVADADAIDWPEARAVVAAEIVDCCRGDENVLRFLQSEVLVPLELRLVGLRDVTPADMVRIALCSLRQREA